MSPSHPAGGAGVGAAAEARGVPPVLDAVRRGGGVRGHGSWRPARLSHTQSAQSRLWRLLDLCLLLYALPSRVECNEEQVPKGRAVAGSIAASG